MTVHFLVPAGYAERPSGGNVYDRQLFTGLVARGWQLHVREVSDADDVAGLVAGLGPDALVLVDSLVASWSAPVLLGSAPRVVPLVHMLFGTPGEHELLVGAPAVVVTSEWTRRRLEVAHGVDPRRVHVAVPGVERAGTGRGSGSGSALVCVGAVVPAKGHDVLVSALAQLLDLDWRCTLVGSLEQDPDFVDELRKTVADAGITDRLTFAGELSPDELGTTYRGADLLVLPSRAETYGMVVTEALARGLPVVASSVGGVPEALGTDLAGDRPGMLVRPGDPAALSRALRRWLEDPSLRRWLRRSAASRWSTLPGWASTAADVSAALEAAQ